jgi:hypothetical protein
VNKSHLKTKKKVEVGKFLQALKNCLRNLRNHKIIHPKKPKKRTKKMKPNSVMENTKLKLQKKKINLSQKS